MSVRSAMLQFIIYNYLFGSSVLQNPYFILFSNNKAQKYATVYFNKICGKFKATFVTKNQFKNTIKLMAGGVSCIRAASLIRVIAGYEEQLSPSLGI